MRSLGGLGSGAALSPPHTHTHTHTGESRGNCCAVSREVHQWTVVDVSTHNCTQRVTLLRHIRCPSGDRASRRTIWPLGQYRRPLMSSACPRVNFSPGLRKKGSGPFHIHMEHRCSFARRLCYLSCPLVVQRLHHPEEYHTAPLHQ